MRLREWVLRAVEAVVGAVLRALAGRKCPYCGGRFHRGQEVVEGVGYRMHKTCRKEVYGA